MINIQWWKECKYTQIPSLCIQISPRTNNSGGRNASAPTYHHYLYKYPPEPMTSDGRSVSTPTCHHWWATHQYKQTKDRNIPMYSNSFPLGRLQSCLMEKKCWVKPSWWKVAKRSQETMRMVEVLIVVRKFSNSANSAVAEMSLVYWVFGVD